MRVSALNFQFSTFNFQFKRGARRPALSLIAVAAIVDVIVVVDVVTTTASVDVIVDVVVIVVLNNTIVG